MDKLWDAVVDYEREYGKIDPAEVVIKTDRETYNKLSRQTMPATTLSAPEEPPENSIEVVIDEQIDGVKVVRKK